MYTSALLLASLVGTMASPILPRRSGSSLNVTDATYDGQCFYPKPDHDFELDEYLGRWYQVAGTVAPFTAGCKCIYAEYSLNSNGTINIQDGCEAGGQEINIVGTATPVSQQAGYGEGGILRVQFPGQPASGCPGPNYIVQEIDQDDDDVGSWAIVQASNFSTLFLLSRQQNPSQGLINRWLNKAGESGTDLSDGVTTDQTDCQFT